MTVWCRSAAHCHLPRRLLTRATSLAVRCRDRLSATRCRITLLCAEGTSEWIAGAERVLIAVGGCGASEHAVAASAPTARITTGDAILWNVYVRMVDLGVEPIGEGASL